MNDDRCLRFAYWAAGQGNDPLSPPAAQIATFYTPGQSLQTIKGYRSCLASVLSRTGNAAAVQAKTIYDMITSVELQRPRMTLVLLQVGPRHCARGLTQVSLCSVTRGLSYTFDLENSLPLSHGLSQKTQ